MCIHIAMLVSQIINLTNMTFVMHTNTDIKRYYLKTKRANISAAALFFKK